MSASKFRVFVVTLSVLGFLAGGFLSYAQVYRALITGEVLDPSKRAIPGATVTVVQQGTQQTSTVRTNAQGNYVLNYLLPGEYKLTVQAPGFEKKVYANVKLESAQRLNLNVTLAVGHVHQAVTVTASPGLVNSATASTGGVIDETKVKNMPATGRMVWMNVTFLQGVRTRRDPFELTPDNFGNSYIVNGTKYTSNAYYLNGAPVGSTGTWQFSPNQDAVQEVQATSNAYNAQYGRAAGGSFNANLKHGTNSFHGDLYEYYNTPGLNANFFKSNLFGLPKPLNQRNTYGGTLGGPIRKDKTFFFVAFEGYRQTYPLPKNDNVPPANWRLLPNGSVDLSGYGFNVYDPATVHLCTAADNCRKNETYARDPFPGDIIPANRISPIGKAILGYYPNPTGAGYTSNYDVLGPRNWTYKQYIGRLDHNLSQKTRLYTVFTYQNTLQHGPGNAFFNAGDTGTSNTHDDINAILDVTHTFSQSVVADAKLSFARFTGYTNYGRAIAQGLTADKLGLTMPQLPSPTNTNIVPQIKVNGMTALFDNRANGSTQNDWNFKLTFAQTERRHLLHYGFDFADFQFGGLGIPGRPNGTFTFGTNWSQKDPFHRANGHDGLGLADLLLGYPSSGSVTWDNNTFVTYHSYGLFIQDAYKVRRNLTLNLGLRWDAYTSPTERYNRINAGFCFTCTNPYNSQVDHTAYPNLPDPLTGKVLFAGVDAPRAPFQVQLANFQPRFGIAWSIMPKLVFRAGYGIFYTHGHAGTNSAGFDQSTPYISSLDGGVTPTDYFPSGTPFPNGAIAPAGANMPQAINVSYDSRNRQVMYAEHWSAGFQYRLPKRTLLDVEYVGEHSQDLNINTHRNIVSETQRAACQSQPSICNSTVANPFYGVVPPAFTMGASAKVPAWRLMVPYPSFPGIAQTDNPIAYSDYNSLQFRVERKIRSLDFVVNYTYSNWMSANHYLNNGKFRDANLWYGINTSDRRHYLTGNVVWPLPFGRGQWLGGHASGLLGGMINNWVFDTGIVYGSGQPLAIPAADFYGPGCTSYIPTGGQTRAHWFNNDSSCYHNLTPWEARTTPSKVGYLRDPAQFINDSALQKRFALPWREMFLRARIEAINAMNHPTFGGPNTNHNAVTHLVPNVGWEGFGTLPLGQTSPPRVAMISLKLTF